MTDDVTYHDKFGREVLKILNSACICQARLTTLWNDQCWMMLIKLLIKVLFYLWFSSMNDNMVNSFGYPVQYRTTKLKLYSTIAKTKSLQTSAISQSHDACAVPAMILQKNRQRSDESFTLTAKLNAITENLSFLLWACVQNEVTGIHKFYRREIWWQACYENCNLKSHTKIFYT